MVHFPRPAVHSCYQALNHGLIRLKYFVGMCVCVCVYVHVCVCVWEPKREATKSKNAREWKANHFAAQRHTSVGFCMRECSHVACILACRVCNIVLTVYFIYCLPDFNICFTILQIMKYVKEWILQIYIIIGCYLIQTTKNLNL